MRRPLLAAALVLLGFALGQRPGAHAETAEASPFQNLSVFARALAHIETSYVDEVDQDALVQGAIRGMTEALDPHTVYLDPEEYRILTADTQGRFAGIGVEITVRDGWLTVLAVFPGGPADQAGLEPGDKFLAIEGRDARDMRIQEAVRVMRGEPGTQVRVAIRRPSASGTMGQERDAAERKRALQATLSGGGHLEAFRDHSSLRRLTTFSFNYVLMFKSP